MYTINSEVVARRRWLVLTICCMSLLIVSLDVSIVNVALPSIQRGLHASVSGLQWTIDGYTLVLAVLLMLSGSVADRFGRRRVFQLGLALFTLGSLLCSVAPSLGWLVVFRMAQAVGGSMLNPVAMSIIVNTFHDPMERARAIGVWGGVVGISLALGPVLGGVLVSGFGWRSIFWINVPIGLAALMLTQLFVAESRAARPRRFDPGAQALIVVLLGSLIFALIEGPNRGWASPLILGLFLLTVLATGGLITLESHRRDPLIDLRFFRSVPFSGANGLALATFAALGGFLFVNALYLQNVRGYTPLQAGLLTLPLAVMTGALAPLSGRLVAARGPRLPLLIAGPAMAAGALSLIGLTPDTPLWQLIGAYLLVGAGFGLAGAPISNTAMSGMPRAQAGVAGAVASTSRQVGASLGVAVIGSLVARSLGAGFTTASHAAWAVIAGCGLLMLILGIISTGHWASGTAARARQLLDPEEVNDGQSLSPAS